MAKKTNRGQSVIEPANPLVLTLASGSTAFTCPTEVVDQYRYMLSILTRDQPLPARIAMIAALPEEGVTYSSLCMALILANDVATRVCVLELNWWRPGLLTLLNGAVSPGLAGAPSVEQAIIQTNVDNLALIPAGQLAVADRPISARSQQLKDTIQNLSQQYDHLILDVPAILATSDAIPLASLADACCIVIRQGATPINTVKRALDDVRHLRMLGVVLNRVKIATPRFIRKWIPQE